MQWTTDIRWGVVPLAFAFLALSGCSGGGGGSGSESGGGAGSGTATGAQVVTALGTPSGSATTTTIDSSGGTITDAGGSFALTIPAGAVPSPTQISVTPLASSTAPWQTTSTGVGITGLANLTSPVTLSVKYSGSTQNPSTDTLGVALQTASGAWWYFSDPVWDGTSMVVTLDPAALSALSGIALAASSKLDAASAWVYDRFTIIGKSDLFVNDFDDYVAAMCNPKKLAAGNAALLKFTDGTCQKANVNGSDAGNVKWSVDAGTLTVHCSTFCPAQYTAPAYVPATNPVTLTAVYNTPTPIPVMKQVTIHDLGKWSVTALFSSEAWPVCSMAAPTSLSDAVTFDLEEVPNLLFLNVSKIHDEPAGIGELSALPLTVTVVTPPEILLETSGVSAIYIIPAPNTPIQVEVTINGTGRSADCLYKGPDGKKVTEETSEVKQQDAVTFRFDPDRKKFGQDLTQTVGPIGFWTFIVKETF